MTCSVLLATEQAAGQRIRVVTRSMGVSDDSLRIRLDMDLNNVQTGNSVSVTFTPILLRSGSKIQQLELPPVVVSGRLRARMERRERFLSPDKAGPLPYQVLYDDEKPKVVDYRVSIPYASWMKQASLLLRQEYKDCCDPELLGVDTLKQNIALTVVPRTEPATVAATPRVPAVAVSANPVMRTVPRKEAWDASALDRYAPMISFLTPDAGDADKNRTESIALYLDYPLGSDNVLPGFKNNREELGKAERVISPLLNNGFSDVRKIHICGYASPDGNYKDNERLASTRSARFGEYVEIAYGVPRNLVETTSVAEDWEGLIGLLRKDKPAYTDAALAVIARYGIFGGREKHLMELQGGVPYKDMLHRFFPKLRRIEVTVHSKVRSVDAGEASTLIYTHPDLLSLEEMYRVARHYRPGTEQYREVYEIAAYHFPDDVVANVNAASAVMLTGDLKSAWEYLRKAESDPRSWNNMGVLTLMEGDAEGAAVWFRKAVGVEPRKARQNLQIVENTKGATGHE